MVYDAKTFSPLHELTEEGEERYRDILEKEADRILFKHLYPFKYFLSKIKEFFERD